MSNNGALDEGKIKSSMLVQKFLDCSTADMPKIQF